MFKKLYKEANDEIPLNNELMEELKAEASKGAKKSYSGFAYRYGYAAAAIVIAVISLRVLPDMTEEPQITPPVPSVISSAEMTEHIATEQQDGDEQYRAPSKVTEETEQRASVDIPKAVTEEADEVIPQESIESTNQPAMANITEEDAGMVGRARIIEHEPEAYSENEDVAETHDIGYSEDDLPVGLMLIGENTLDYDGSLEAAYQRHYQGEGKSMSIAVYPESKPVRDMLESMGKDTEACVFEENGEDECKAYLVTEEKGFIIESKGIETGELEEFVNSIG